MIKSPAQWSKAFSEVSKSDEFIVDVKLRQDQIEELKNLMTILSEVLDIDQVKERLEKFCEE